MKKTTSRGLGMLMAPALALSVSVALAQDHRTKPESTQGQKSSQSQTSSQSQKSARSQAQHSSQYKPMATRPADSILSDDLIGSPLMSKQAENFGPINNLIIGKDGQVLAVIVSVGGFLGIGQRDVAIAWDALERSVDGDGDAVFHVDMTDAELRDAPAYRND